MTQYEVHDGWFLTNDAPECGSTAAPVLRHRDRTLPPDAFSGSAAARVAAWAIVLMRAEGAPPDDERILLADQYLRQWEDGPQLIDIANFVSEGKLNV